MSVDKRKKFKGKLPNKILPFTTADKKNHEKWHSKRNIANFPCPCKILVIGPPNVGKTSTVFNIVLRSKPMYDNVYIIQEFKNSAEYDELEPTEILDKIPPPEFFNGEEKNLIILEDFECNKNDVNLSKLFRITGSHCKTTIILLYQSFFRCMPLARRLSDVYIIYRMNDCNEMDMISRRVGYDKNHFNQLFNSFCNTKYDSICFDLTPHSPAPLRLNIFQPIRKKIQVIPKE